MAAVGVSDNVFLAFLIIVVLWDVVWKGIALWKSSKAGSLKWFVALLLLNTAGLLPILYLLFFAKKKRIVVSSKRKKV
jgi:hypothetical protein